MVKVGLATVATAAAVAPVEAIASVAGAVVAWLAIAGISVGALPNRSERGIIWSTKYSATRATMMKAMMKPSMSNRRPRSALAWAWAFCK